MDIPPSHADRLERQEPVSVAVHAAAWSSECGGAVRSTPRSTPAWSALRHRRRYGRQSRESDVVPARHRVRVQVGARGDDRALGQGPFAGKPVVLGGGGSTGPRRGPPGCPGENAGLDAQCQRRPPLGRTVGRAIQHAPVAALDRLAEAGHDREGQHRDDSGLRLEAGMLTTKPDELDEMVSSGVRSGYLRMTA